MARWTARHSWKSCGDSWNPRRHEPCLTAMSRQRGANWKLTSRINWRNWRAWGCWRGQSKIYLQKAPFNHLLNQAHEGLQGKVPGQFPGSVSLVEDLSYRRLPFQTRYQRHHPTIGTQRGLKAAAD